MKKVTNAEKGITMIALIVIIVILLILAETTISMLTEFNSLIEKTKEAKIKMQKEEDREKLQLAVVDSYDEHQKVDKDKLNTNLPEGFTENNGIYESNYGNRFEIENNIVVDVKWKESEDGSITNGIITLQVGDYVNYNPTMVTLTSNSQVIKDLQEYSGYEGTEYNTEKQIIQEDLDWRVLDVKAGKLRLISSQSTNFTVHLKGYNGYNNAVFLLDEVCRTLYGGKKAAKVQSLKIDDIQDKITYNYKDYENSDANTGKYGGTKEYSDDWHRHYPSIFAKEISGWVDGKEGRKYTLSEQTELIKQTENNQANVSIKVSETHWDRVMQDSDWKNSIYQELFIKENNGVNFYRILAFFSLYMDCFRLCSL